MGMLQGILVMLEASIFLLGARLHLDKLFLLDKCLVTPVYEFLTSETMVFVIWPRRDL